jgi:glycerol-3-phosphate acyltransferase PlsX
MARVALDAMGGDHAPTQVVAGAVQAIGEGHDVVLVGDEAVLGPLVAEVGVAIDIVHASQVIEMGAHPTRALRESPDASVIVAARLVKEGLADALVSAGSTGAAMAAAVFTIGRVPGVQRPPIASIIPASPKPVVMLDSGANPDCKPQHLAQFAVLGAVMAETYLDLDHVRVGLLNIGSEKGKGRELEKAAWDLLEALGEVDERITFVGNVEGRDLATGAADVMVSDGYTGNMLIKTAEGVVSMFANASNEAMTDFSDEERAGALKLLNSVGERYNHEASGGGHLLGLNGVVVIAHGSSSASAIAASVALADRGASNNLAGRVAQRIAQDIEG